MKLLVVLILILIIASLGSALIYMLRGRGEHRQMVRALTLRIGLSLALFAMLLLGYVTGVIEPNRFAMPVAPATQSQ